VLNGHNFFERHWAPTVADIVNFYFDALVVHFTYYTTPLSEAALKFRGVVIARAFGRESPRTYAEFVTQGSHPDLLAELAALEDRFIFGQGYDNLADIEPPEIRRRAHTITVPLPPEVFQHQSEWRGGGTHAVFLCPAILPSFDTYYRDIYEGIKRDFATLPHVIFGRQVGPVNDPAVLPYLTDAQLFNLYVTAPVFVYPHTEPRHVHYSPLEAIVVGTPTLYLRGALIDRLMGGADLPGSCADVSEMLSKAQRLLAGDAVLAEAIRATQRRVLHAFAPDLARQQWAEALPN
jgi:hypothetical protein